MTITVSTWLEALEVTEGRFRTLGRVRLLRDAEGGPRMAMASGGAVDFEIEADGEPLTLRCPLSSEGAARLRDAVERDDGLGGRFFTEWRVAEREVAVFDAAGAAARMDVALRRREEGTALVDFLGVAAARDDWDAVCRASESFEELARWAAGVSRAVSLGRLSVSEGGEVRVREFSLADGTARIRAMLRAALAGMNRDLSREEPEPFVDDATDNGVPPALATGYEEVAWDGRLGLAVVMSEGEWSLVDGAGRVLTAEPYDWLGEWSEGLLLAVRGGRCGFVDPSGVEVIPCRWDDATSFADGMALVTSDGESFFVDRLGERV